MTWVKQDDRECWNKKIRQVSDAAFRLHEAGRGWCSQNLTDGHVAPDQIQELGVLLKPARTAKASLKLIAELVDARVWHHVSAVCDQCVRMRAEKQVTEPIPTTGWLIHDYLDYNFPAWKVKEEQAAARRRAADSYARRKTGHAGAETATLPEHVRPQKGHSAPESAPVSADPPSRPVPSQVRSTRTPSLHNARARAEDAAANAAGTRREGLRAIGSAVATVAAAVKP